MARLEPFKILDRTGKPIISERQTDVIPGGLKFTGPDELKFRGFELDHRHVSRYGITPVKWADYNHDQALCEAGKSFYFTACIDAIVEAVSSVRLRVFEMKASENWEPAPKHPLQLLLDRPNRSLTRKTMIERLAHHMLLSGNEYWTKHRSKDTVLELWPLANPDEVTPKVSPTQFIDSYLYGNAYDGKKIKVEDMIHFRKGVGTSLISGSGHVSGLERLLQYDSETLGWNLAVVQYQE